jgi:hypothetical protein
MGLLDSSGRQPKRRYPIWYSAPPMERPPGVCPDQVWVLRAKFETGHILGQAGQVHLAGDAPAHVTFDSVEQARAYCERLVAETPEVECILYRDNAETEVFRNVEGYDRKKTEEERSRRRWWHFWRRV